MKHSFIDKYSNLSSPIHRLDTKLKLTVFFSIALLVSLLNFNNFVLLILFFILLFVSKLAKIPIRFILTRMFIVFPFIFIIAISYFVIFKNFYKLINMSLKSFVIILSFILLIQTTKFNVFVETLKSLKFSNFLLLLLSFIYRYFFVLTDEVEKMSFAVKLRLQEKLKIKTLSKIVGMVLIRSFERAERINKVMQLRGWDGKI